MRSIRFLSLRISHNTKALGSYSRTRVYYKKHRLLFVDIHMNTHKWGMHRSAVGFVIATPFVLIVVN